MLFVLDNDALINESNQNVDAPVTKYDTTSPESLQGLLEQYRVPKGVALLDGHTVGLKERVRVWVSQDCLHVMVEEENGWCVELYYDEVGGKVSKRYSGRWSGGR